VAAKAGVQNLLGGKRRERTDGLRSAAVLGVKEAGAVASLAARTLWWLLTGSDALEVRILIKIIPDDRMARSADRIFYELVGWFILRIRDEDPRAEYY
jgi:hypothetical protein